MSAEANAEGFAEGHGARQSWPIPDTPALVGDTAAFEHALDDLRPHYPTGPRHPRIPSRKGEHD